MSIPSNWIPAWARSGAAGTDLVGKKYDVAYIAPAGTTLAIAEAALPYGAYYTGQSGIFGSRHRFAEVRPDLKTKEVLVTYHYLPPSVEEALILDTSLVRVDVRSENFAHRPFIDINADYVWHEERDADGGPSCKWEPVSGAGIRFDSRMQFRTRFARDYGMGGNLLSYQNTVNGATYSQYWCCPTGTLRFAAWTKYRAPTVDKLWIYDCLIVYSPLRWNLETIVQKYEYKVYRIERLDAAGASFTPAQYKTVGDWVPTGAEYPAELYESKQWPLVIGNYDW